MSTQHPHEHTHEHHHDAEHYPFYWNLIVSGVIIATLLILEEGFSLYIQNEPLRVLIYVIAYLLPAIPVFKEGWKSIVKRDFFNEFTLMGIASLGALIIGEYAEGVTVMLFYSIGEIFQDKAVNRARKSIEHLIATRPNVATVIENQIPVERSAKEVSVGEIIRVNPWQRVPLDGELLADAADFNPSALTGESLPTTKMKNELVMAGLMNCNKAVDLRVVKPYEETMLARILKMVQEATAHKSKIETFISKFAHVYTQIVVAIAVGLVFIPYLFIGDYQFYDWFHRGLVFLVLSCPCALVISIPLGYFGGIGLSSHNGILFKGANYLDAMTKVDTVVLDKTGTLTEGAFRVKEVVFENNNNIDNQTLLEMVCTIETKSNHPLAVSIQDYARLHQIKISKDEFDVEEVPGRGLKARYNNQTVLVGSPAFLEMANITFPSAISKIHQTMILFAVNGIYCGYFIIGDEIKSTAFKAIQRLKKRGLHTLMLSGDRKALVESIGETLGIDESYGDLLPEEKLEKVRALQKEGHRVAFVGDGVNDAPALALADVGIAMGGLGSDSAIEVADVVIQDDNPMKIDSAIRAGNLTRRIIWQNITFAVGAKLTILLFAAHGDAGLWEAVFADVGVALIAIANAVRLQRFKLLRDK